MALSAALEEREGLKRHAHTCAAELHVFFFRTEKRKGEVVPFIDTWRHLYRTRTNGEFGFFEKLSRRRKLVYRHLLVNLVRSRTSCYDVEGHCSSKGHKCMIVSYEEALLGEALDITLLASGVPCREQCVSKV